MKCITGHLGQTLHHFHLSPFPSHTKKSTTFSPPSLQGFFTNLKSLLKHRGQTMKKNTAEAVDGDSKMGLSKCENV